MKKSLLVVMVLVGLLIAAPAMGLEWLKDEGVLEWDAVTTLVDGTPIPVTDDPPLYRVLRRHRTTGVETLMGETTQTQYPAPIDAEGYYYAGVYSVRMFEGAPVITEGVEMRSTVTWSDSTDIEAVPVPFGLSSWLALMQPKGLRLVP